MNHKKKIGLIVFITIFISIVSLIQKNVHAAIIYQSSSKDIITSGATLEKIKRFTTDGWLNINVIRADLTNKNIKVATMSSKNSIKTLMTTQAIAQQWNAIAAVNAGFFNWLKGAAFPDGTIIQSNSVLSAYTEYNRYQDSMASFSISNANDILFNYFKTSIKITSKNGYTLDVWQYNKASILNYNDVTVLDRRWSNISIGTSTGFNDIVEMLVDNNKVVEIRKNQTAVDIPSNGYVVIARGDYAKSINSNFNIGDYVEFTISTTPDWNSIKYSVAGSAMLLVDGNVPKRFSFDIPGKNPRTAIGTTLDKKQLIIATVDGRQASSIGMSQTEMALLMKELGAYNALNLDGGGSTTMVSRHLGESTLSLINSPSDGSQRLIATSVGIFSNSPSSTLNGLIIDILDKNIYVNTQNNLSIRGFDKFYNPLDISKKNVSLNISGISGTFKNNMFMPTSEGNGTITASIGDIKATLNITAYKPISILYPKNEILEPYKKTLDNYRLAIFPKSRDAKNLLERFLSTNFSDKTKNSVDKLVILGSAKCDLEKSMNSALLSSTDGYKVIDTSYTKIISLDTTKKSIRLSNASQWDWLISQINSVNDKNIIIMLPECFENFVDKLEAKLFQDIIIEKAKTLSKKIYIIYNGDGNYIKEDKNINYVSVKGIGSEVVNPLNVDTSKTLVITLEKSNIKINYTSIY